MELRQLRYFLAIAEHGTYRAAADDLGISQQALSHSISELERDIGAQLFNRGSFGATLTAVGDTFRTRARLICGEVALASREAQALGNGSWGHVRFGVGAALAPRVVPEVVARYSATRPKVKLSCFVEHASALLDRLHHGELEFVVSTAATNSIQQEGLTYEALGNGLVYDAIYLVMRPDHPLLAIEQPTIHEMVSFPWVMPETIMSFNAALFAFFGKQGVAGPPYVFHTDSFWVTNAVLMRSDFVALTGRETAAIEIDAGQLAGIPVPGFEARRPAFACFRERSPLQPAASGLLELFKSVIASDVRLAAAWETNKGDL